MKGWTWQQKQTSGEAFENNVGEWVRNEFDENNPCERMKSLWNAIENNSSNDPKNLWEVIKPLRDLIFTETNKINDLMDKKLAVHVAESPLNNAFISYNYNDFWICDKPQEDSAYDAIRGNGYNSYQFSDDSLEFQGISAWPEECAITFQSDNDSSIQTYSLNPNAINITFSQLSWCNIDRLLSEYGQISSCKLKGNFPDNAQVKIVFKDLNGALSCDFSDDGFVAKRLPEGYDLMFLVYFKDGDSIKFGTQTITAAEEMTFNDENLKTLTDMDALVEEIEKIVD